MTMEVPVTLIKKPGKHHELTDEESRDLHAVLTTWKTLDTTIKWIVGALVTLSGAMFMWGLGVRSTVERHDIRIDGLEKQTAIWQAEVRDSQRMILTEMANLRGEIYALREGLAAHNGAVNGRTGLLNGNKLPNHN